MRCRSNLFVLAFFLSGCATSATGPTFNSEAGPTPPLGFVRVYVFRDKVLYLAQAPYIAQTQIAVDGHIVGRVANGGYIVTNVAAGRHSITAGFGAYQTSRDFDAASSGDGYIEITDKTRMEGTRMIVEGAVGALVARENAIQATEGRRQMRQDEIAGAMDAISQDESFSGPERVWDISFPLSTDALPRLSLLRSSS